MEPFPAVLLLRGDALRLLGRHDAAVDDYGDYVEILRRRGFDVRRHPQMKAANDMWGKLLSAGHKSMRRQHNPRAQKFDWTGNRWRQWYAAQEKGATFPTSKAPMSAVFHSFRLIFGRSIIPRSALEACVLFPERALAEHSR